MKQNHTAALSGKSLSYVKKVAQHKINNKQVETLLNISEKEFVENLLRGDEVRKGCEYILRAKNLDPKITVRFTTMFLINKKLDQEKHEGKKE